MSTVITHDMLVRRALSFLEERRRERPELPLEKLLDEAGERFNLSPADGEALAHVYRAAVLSGASEPSGPSDPEGASGARGNG